MVLIESVSIELYMFMVVFYFLSEDMQCEQLVLVIKAFY